MGCGVAVEECRVWCSASHTAPSVWCLAATDAARSKRLGYTDGSHNVPPGPPLFAEQRITPRWEQWRGAGAHNVSMIRLLSAPISNSMCFMVMHASGDLKSTLHLWRGWGYTACVCGGRVCGGGRVCVGR